MRFLVEEGIVVIYIHYCTDLIPMESSVKSFSVKSIFPASIKLWNIAIFFFKVNDIEFKISLCNFLVAIPSSAFFWQLVLYL